MSDDDTDEESDAPLVQVHLLKGEGERGSVTITLTLNYFLLYGWASVDT